jgi:hypothetical protein
MDKSSSLIIYSEECLVQPPVQNVFTLHAQRRSFHDLPVALECLHMAVQELDNLRRCVERVVCDPHWSALEWRAACTPLLLRLPGARQSLAELDDIIPGQWPDTDWAVRLRAARDEVELRLTDVSTSVSALTHGEAIIVDGVFSFSVDCTRLAKAADELSGMIASRYPEAAGAI